MSFQWTLVATYLYVEIFIVIILLLPILSPRRWHIFLNSYIFDAVRDKVTWYFYAFLIILTLFFFDAVREMRKYSHPSDSGHSHLADEMKASVKLFRAQRNFYITSFAIFLTFVIRRIISMILKQHKLELKSQQIIKKAKESVQHAKTTIMEHNLRVQEQPSDDDIRCRLEVVENLLVEQKFKTKEMAEEAMIWKRKFEELGGVAGDNQLINND